MVSTIFTRLSLLYTLTTIIKSPSFSGVFRVKNHDFTPKKSYFFNFRGGARNFWGISYEKSRFYAKKIIFLPILGGRAPGAPPPPESAPGLYDQFDTSSCAISTFYGMEVNKLTCITVGETSVCSPYCELNSVYPNIDNISDF